MCKFSQVSKTEVIIRALAFQTPLENTLIAQTLPFQARAIISCDVSTFPKQSADSKWQSFIDSRNGNIIESLVAKLPLSRAYFADDLQSQRATTAFGGK